MATLTLKVNGESVTQDVPSDMLLVQFIRETLRLTGTHVGCDTAQCGACTVHLNGRAIKSCNMLAVQAAGTRADDDRRHLRRATARCIRCRQRSRPATGCSAASAHRAW